MLRLSRPLLSTAARSQCHYEVLGVARGATSDEIKSAFKDQVKETHPDTNEAGASPTKTKKFTALVEAYRVLRDDKKRREYDLEMANKRNYSQGQTGSSTSSGFRPNDTAAAPAPRNPMEFAPFVGILLGGAFLFFNRAATSQTPYKDTEHPRKQPRTSQMNIVAGTSRGGPELARSPSITPSRTEGSLLGDGTDFRVSGAELATSQSPDELVQAFYDPFFERWYKIPEGYQAPAGMDLTAWHNKRTDPVEWSRLYAEGKLSQLIPRGGLQVRYLPTWQTHEPIIICDPITGKTVAAEGRQLRPRGMKEKCEVQF